MKVYDPQCAANKSIGYRGVPLAISRAVGYDGGMDENSRRFQFRLSDGVLAMTIFSVWAAQVAINYPGGLIRQTPSTASRIIAGLNFAIFVVGAYYYKSNRRRTLWIATLAAIVATIVGVLIGKLAG